MADTLGAILSSARIQLGWSLRDAERKTGIANAHISQMETGKITAPGIAHLAKLAKAYRLPLRRLLEAAGQGADWSLVTEVSEEEIRADERERIAHLALEQANSIRRGSLHTIGAEALENFAALIRKGGNG